MVDGMIVLFYIFPLVSRAPLCKLSLYYRSMLLKLMLASGMKIVRHNSLPARNSFDWRILFHFCTTLTVCHSSFMDNEQAMSAINVLCNGFNTQGKIDLRWSVMYRFQCRRKVGFGSRINFSSTSFASISDRGSTIYEIGRASCRERV